MKARSPILILLLALTTLPLEAQILTGPVRNLANGHDYYLTVQSTRTAADATAQGLGGHLATINDEAENFWVFSTFGLFHGQPRNLWIGLRVWATHWDDGDPSGYRNFAPGEPNFGDPFIYIIAPGIPASGQWNNCPDVDAAPYSGQGGAGSLPLLPIHGVIEVVPEPSTTILVMIAASLFFLRQRGLLTVRSSRAER